ncbi:ligase-associated DNA damage response endonuclease PdeM [Xinfangfangia sp. CPCC 101601]|uniref:Ligase-associated DNA damage response endonuclease PdeM n=1 Tax=Pseudogemmobacter lacusdianii TaxID=3069608 RepID=A0ABU0W2H3_9RHOB|nr:ligase-associated DNA damage response endonuclease PdeM [Xinfangfangia sp. CPCC 101601]MDQ2067275.1 ligase-associated DNA damage response endonuclease PdeM [Xinfangfangia sp. CPCC 101601]
MHFGLTLGSENLHALPSGALYWPAQKLLVVSDLHLGKSHRLARRAGQLLPPYESRATLQKLDADIAALRPATVVCLGDSFDDLESADSLDSADSLLLAQAMAGREWIWVEGNHDPGPLDLGGTHRAELKISGLSLRHIANPSERYEISGHFHPKARLAGQAKPCFLVDDQRLIMPAYGAYTGGLWTESPALTSLMQPRALAILTGTKARAIPMPR